MCVSNDNIREIRVIHIHPIGQGRSCMTPYPPSGFGFEVAYTVLLNSSNQESTIEMCCVFLHYCLIFCIHVYASVCVSVRVCVCVYTRRMW